MIYFQIQQTPKHQWVIYEDHDLHGYISDKDESDDIILYTKKDAEEEIELFKKDKDVNLNIIHMDHYQENYRAFQNGDNTRTEGKTPKQRV